MRSGVPSGSRSRSHPVSESGERLTLGSCFADQKPFGSYLAARRQDDRSHGIDRDVLLALADAPNGHAAQRWIAAPPELFVCGRAWKAQVLIEGHEEMTYTGCKVASSLILHGDAFSSLAARRILSYMERKATYIRAWRKERHLSLDDVVGRLAVMGVETTGASLSRIERGLQPYNQDMLEAIAAALDVPASYLIERNPELPPAKVYDLLQHLNAAEAEQADKVLRAMFGDRAG